MTSSLTDLYSSLHDCRMCRLGGAYNRFPVPGYGNLHSPILLIGEAPGKQEILRPFVGPSGKELAKLLSDVGLDLDSGCYRTNVVHCWPGPGNPTPTREETAVCGDWLDAEIALLEPHIIVAMGYTAIRHFLPGIELVSEVRGKPRMIDLFGNDVILLPTYHPAAALHNSAMMKHLQQDFTLLPKLLSNTMLDVTDVSDVFDQYPNPDYRLLPSGWKPNPSQLTWSVDTETDQQGRLWCLSMSSEPGTGFVVWRKEVHRAGEIFHPPYTLVFHNATFDLNILSAAGIRVTAEVHDTMLMAHLLEEERLSLKILAKHLLGMEMRDYSDVVKPYQEGLSLKYLSEVVAGVWPEPEQEVEMVWDKGKGLLTHTRHPQRIGRKAARIIEDTANKGADPWERWGGIDPKEREMVELSLGPMPVATLEEVPEDVAMRYSARDADATLRLFYLLRGRI